VTTVETECCVFIAQLKVEKLHTSRSEYELLRVALLSTIHHPNQIKDHFIRDIYEIYSPGLERNVSHPNNAKSTGHAILVMSGGVSHCIVAAESVSYFA